MIANSTKKHFCSDKLHTIIIITSLRACKDNDWLRNDVWNVHASFHTSWQTTTPMTYCCCDHCMIQVRPLSMQLMLQLIHVELQLLFYYIMDTWPWSSQLVCYPSNRMMSLRLLFLTVYEVCCGVNIFVYSHSAWLTSTSATIGTSIANFFCNKWSKPALVHFLLGNSFNNCTAYFYAKH